jgi:HPt (histidine-containing phosphotransfer) domain-containing protein
MNDYIAKPVDERILYSKMMTLLKKPMSESKNTDGQNSNGQNTNKRCIDLGSLNQRTRRDPKLMIEMISLYLDQTPALINAMKQSIKDKDWNGLHMAAHKMIPSFSIMGIHEDFENMAKKIQEYAVAQQQAEGMDEIVLQLENICLQACQELQDELNELKTQTYAK